jgi:3-phosphoshikimate 1-carboxyvinyltransferase
MQIKIKPAKSMSGVINIPGDKSISHRACIFGAIANGKTIIHNFLNAEDTLRTVGMFKQMGVKIKLNKDTLTIDGKGLDSLKKPETLLYAGNSGTTARLMLGILAGQKFSSTIDGDKYLRKRPMLRVVEPLRKMGANITGKDNGNYLPLEITGKRLKPINYRLKVASAQVKSAILLAGLYAKGKTIISEPAKSRDHTERMMDLFGAGLEVNGLQYSIKGNFALKAKKIMIPGDISSASFFIVAATLIKNSEILIKNVGVNQTRIGLIDVLKRMGADITIERYSDEYNDPIADVRVKYSILKGMEIKGNVIPKIIDEIPILAVAGCFAYGTTIIRDAKELRVKESDRIKTMVTELKRMGANIKELPDGMVIIGQNNLNGAECKSYGDHRIAMSIAIAGLLAKGETTISDTDCINTSFPEFLKILKEIRK